MTMILPFLLVAIAPAPALPVEAALHPRRSEAARHAGFLRADRPKKRYSVTVPIGKPKPAVALPRIEGPDNPRLPLVVIDAGHGGHDPGATSPYSGKREKDLTLELARAIRDDLVAGGRVRVALTRSDDRYLVLEERYGIARRLKADLFLSIHADAAENEQANGASVYTLSEVASDREAARLAARENKANIINGVDLGAHSSDVSSILLDLTQRETMNAASDFARLLQREASDEMTFRTTAHRFASFVVLKAPDMPSVLFETGFISNRRDSEFLTSKAGQRKVARGVRDAVQIHFARKIAAAR
ncbi:MAG: N-acetylmuramoyl-L-alanine amidase [Sphingopyxis sp.]|jgi:N-acetylmuramoyl-L-alanine amidase|nr:N-acetylmuramoyl-L-alanine amidase [Sphingopyxis sp.]